MTTPARTLARNGKVLLALSCAAMVQFGCVPVGKGGKNTDTKTATNTSTGTKTNTSTATKTNTATATATNTSTSTVTSTATVTNTATSTSTSTGVSTVGCPAGATVAALGSNIQSVVNAAGNGATICIAAGEHRLQQIQPRNSQKIYGATGAILNGSRLLTSFTREGSLFVASGQTQQGERIAADECADGVTRCGYPEAFFINNQPLTHVDAKTKVAPGKYFFDYAADKIYFYDDPSGKKVETSVTPYAIRSTASNVLVQGLIVEKYAVPLQRAAVFSDGPGWVIQNNESRLNHGVGMFIGTNGKLLNNYIHDNGEMGFSCVGTDILVEGNEIARNGFFSGIDVAWEGGGSKCAVSTRLTFRNNYSHHNNGYGLWTDIDNVDVLYEGNRLEYNSAAGISHEISYAAVIRNNTLKGNGHGGAGWLWGGGIQIQDSQNVEVYNNHIEVGAVGNGLAIIEQDRGNGAFGPYRSANNYVHHNVVIMTAVQNGGGNGMVSDHNPAGMQAQNNRFDYNQYHVRRGNENEDFFGWADNFYTFSQIRSRFGQERNGQLVIVP